MYLSNTTKDNILVKNIQTTNNFQSMLRTTKYMLPHMPNSKDQHQRTNNLKPEYLLLKNRSIDLFHNNINNKTNINESFVN